jgi:Mlc titration factor MtfA (ptsG expression regulator)
MIPIFVVVGLALAVIVAVVGMQASKAHRRQKLIGTPPPESWGLLLEKTLPMIAKLTKEQWTQLAGYMQVFLAEKNFEGCGGLELTEEMKVTVAAQACMLLIGRSSTVYPKLKSILLYPHTYTDGEQARLGESWNTGVVVLSWNSVAGGARNFEDGHNVTFHEFAHQLDQEDGAADGVPILQERSAYSAWAKVFHEEYAELVDKTQRGRKDTMDRYGATNPAEFFAVATETFFEKPKQLKDKHPELYEELQYYYHVDPVQWT